MEAVPGGGKFKKLRKRLFTRTRRGYRNEGGDISTTGDNDDATATTTTTTEEEGEFAEPIDGDFVNELDLLENNKQQEMIIEASTTSTTTASTTREENQQQLQNALRKTKPKRKKKREPVVVETVEELRSAILDQQLSLSDTVIVEPKKKKKTDTDTDTASTTTATSTSTEEEEDDVPLMDHAVRNLIKERYFNGSTPGNRPPHDNSTLALAIEGGGMRGCVSAGMVAAITALGLGDSIDTIYGSSAGSVVGAYMVSRQVCMDVYVDILPASKKLFVCKKRMATNLASLSLGRMLSKKNTATSSSSDATSASTTTTSLASFRDRLANSQPGMNISFVLDGILDNDHGLRPLDLESFRQNDQKQTLRVVSSCVDPHTGKLYSKCFGRDDFFHDEHAVRMSRGGGGGVGDHHPSLRREGLFACLQASMTVPGATGPPVKLIRKKSSIISNSKSNSNNCTDQHDQQQDQQIPLPCFDAFCFEPIPYRSAVEEGATHVLVLTSRPGDYQPITKPGIYETRVAPLYFNSHGYSSVADYFSKGGQQYVYAEDLMLLEEAKHEQHKQGQGQGQGQGVLVPPPNILYGVPRTKDIAQSIYDRQNNWKRAHLFPIKVPKGHKELDVLDQDKDAVLEAVRGGFMAAFDSLKDIVGLEGFRGKDVAELVFPASSSSSLSADDTTTTTNNNDGSSSSSSSNNDNDTTLSLSALEEDIMGTRLRVPGEPIPEYGAINGTTMMAMAFGGGAADNYNIGGSKKKRAMMNRMMTTHGGGGIGLFGHGSHHNHDTTNTKMNNTNQEQETTTTRTTQEQRQEEFSRTLLDCLPGFQDGRYAHLAKGLRQNLQQ